MQLTLFQCFQWWMIYFKVPSNLNDFPLYYSFTLTYSYDHKTLWVFLRVQLSYLTCLYQSVLISAFSQQVSLPFFLHLFPLILLSLHCGSLFPACSDGRLSVFNKRLYFGEQGELTLSCCPVLWSHPVSCLMN